MSGAGSVERFLRRSRKRGRLVARHLAARLWAAVGNGGDTAATVREFVSPGPLFEAARAMEAERPPARARVIAFYLPQFHAFAENDAWWGKGFSEWRNVARGTPRFAGHHQPRVPRDLGFYDLGDARVLHEQARLAKAAGVEAFCFYHYWFDGKRLMEAPLERFLAEAVDRDFCIMWANENWTRTWDGLESEVLIEQSYRRQDEPGFIADTARYMAHPRYVRVDGRPLFILYRAGLLPSSRETLARWRKAWTIALGVEPWILMAQGFGEENPTEHGLDGAVEFPPHKICDALPDVTPRLQLLDRDFRGVVKSYAAAVERSLGEATPAFPLIKTVTPGWDNDARRQGRGMVLHGSTPALYERWLDGAIRHATARPFAGDPIVFVNAWNEWAEGAYLEPDVHFGHAYLNATRRAVHAPRRIDEVVEGERPGVLLVGHDAHRHGAQMILLHLARALVDAAGVEVSVALRAGGPLLAEYRAIAPTVVLGRRGPTSLARVLRASAADIAICNTAVCGDLVPAISAAGLEVVALVHELPRLVEQYGLEEHLRAIAAHADHVVFPSGLVERGFRRFAPAGTVRASILPQGLYFTTAPGESDRSRLRATIGVGRGRQLVLGAGYADLRKGFDLFVETARRVLETRDDVHFAWVGELSEDMRIWVAGDVDASQTGDERLAERLHLIGFSDEMPAWHAASDAFLLSSREDPYPTVVLEALHAGRGVVLFDGATGMDTLAARFGKGVPRGDTRAAAAAIEALLAHDTAEAVAARTAYVDRECRFDDYAFALLALVRPAVVRRLDARRALRPPARDEEGLVPIEEGATKEGAAGPDASTTGAASRAA